MANYIAPEQTPFKFTTASNLVLNQQIFDWDTQALPGNGLSLQLLSLGTGGVITIEFSSNEQNYTTGWMESIDFTVGVQGSVLSSAGTFNIPKLARFIRARVSTVSTAGTTTLAVTPINCDFRVANAAVSGAVPHDSVLSGNPIRIAGRAANINYAAVANGDVADLLCTLNGVLVQKPFSIPDADWQATGAYNLTTDVAIKTAGGASLRNYMTGIQFSGSITAAVELQIKDGTTIIWRATLPASAFSRDITFPTPLRSAANTALNIAFSAAPSSSVVVNAQGYSSV